MPSSPLRTIVSTTTVGLTLLRPFAPCCTMLLLTKCSRAAVPSPNSLPKISTLTIRRPFRESWPSFLSPRILKSITQRIKFSPLTSIASTTVTAITISMMPAWATLAYRRPSLTTTKPRSSPAFQMHRACTHQPLT